MLQLHLYLFHMASYGDRTSLAAKKQKPIRACQQNKTTKFAKVQTFLLDFAVNTSYTL